ncbi:unnamed protein product [Chrysoparadoxa australica]
MSGKLTQVGLIGLGNMGSGMAKNIAKAGFSLTLYDREPMRMKALEASNVRAAVSAGDVMRHSDVTLLSLDSEAAGEDVVWGETGLVAGAKSKHQAPHRRPVVVDTGTMSPAYSLSMHERLRQEQIAYLDCPVSGGPSGAAAGTLSLMAGGSKDDLDTCKDVLEAIAGPGLVRLMEGHVVLSCSSVTLSWARQSTTTPAVEVFILTSLPFLPTWQGQPGAGTAAKLVNQMLVIANTVAACEAYALAESLGVQDKVKLRGVLEEAWGQSAMLSKNWEDLARLEPLGHEAMGKSQAPLRNLEKDLGIITRAAQSAGLELPAFPASAKLLDQAMAEGNGESDFCSMSRLIR